MNDTQIPGVQISLPQTGGCQCGALRYELGGLPVAFFICHCMQCQTHSASAFAESLQVHAGDLKVTGPSRQFARRTERGTVTEALFCPDCGTRIIHRRASSDFCNIRAGTLDDTSWLVPAAHIWLESKQPWVPIGTGALTFARQPDDLSVIQERWQAMLAAPVAPQSTAK